MKYIYISGKVKEKWSLDIKELILALQWMDLPKHYLDSKQLKKGHQDNLHYSFFKTLWIAKSVQGYQSQIRWRISAKNPLKLENFNPTDFQVHGPNSHPLATPCIYIFTPQCRNSKTVSLQFEQCIYIQNALHCGTFCTISIA